MCVCKVYKVIHVHSDLRKMLIALVWNNLLHTFPFSYNYPSRSFLCMQISIHYFIIELHISTLINLMTLNYTPDMGQLQCNVLLLLP